MECANRQSCMEEDEVETFRHFLFYCSAFAIFRLKNLRSHTFCELGELAAINISCLNKFVTGSRRFKEYYNDRSFKLSKLDHSRYQGNRPDYLT